MILLPTSQPDGSSLTLAGMAFRVLIIGGRAVDFGHLRDTLDRLLVNRLPDVELVTAGGPGIPALVASYAASRGLSHLPLPIDHAKHPGDAEEQRADRLIEVADAALVVWEEVEPVREMVARLRAKGVPVVVIGPERPPASREDEQVEPRRVLRGMPPD